MIADVAGEPPTMGLALRGTQIVNSMSVFKIFLSTLKLTVSERHWRAVTFYLVLI